MLEDSLISSVSGLKLVPKIRIFFLSFKSMFSFSTSSTNNGCKSLDLITESKTRDFESSPFEYSKSALTSFGKQLPPYP